MDKLKFENEFLKNNSRFYHLIPYFYLFFKSKPLELSLNIKLLRLFKKFNLLDIGFYLKENPELKNFLKYGRFSPELHYICYGFYEKRQFYKKIPIFTNKKELINYLNELI